MASVSKRGESFTIRISTGYDSKGRQIKKNTTYTPEPGMTEKQIEKALARQCVLLEEKAATGHYVDSNIKFSDFTELWMNDHAKKNLAPKTIHDYAELLININTAMGHIRLDRLQPQHLIRFYDNLSQRSIRQDKRFIALPGLEKKIVSTSKSAWKFAKAAHLAHSTVKIACSGQNISEKSAETIAKALKGKITNYFKYATPDKCLSGNTIKHYHRLISSILQTAVMWQVIESNPARRVKTPKAERTEAKYLDEKQAKQVLELLDEEHNPFRTMIMLCIYSGLRRGELCGLQWGDIDFDSGVLHVRRALQYIPGIGTFAKHTKTFGSTRSIKLSSIVILLLRQYKKWQDEERLRLGDAWQSAYREKAESENGTYTPIEWLFPTWEGMPMQPDTLTSWFHDFVIRNHLPQVCIHSLRHTNATLMIAGGTDIRTVSNRLGHSQTSITMNIYSHAIQSTDAAAADTLEDLLEPGKSSMPERRAN